MGLIIDMEKPKACVWEKASHVLDVCNMIHRCPYAKASAEKRPEGCLIKGEIPDKHGRLIDAETLKGILSRVPSKGIRTYFFAEVGQVIDEAPTVVEATE